MTYVFFDPDFEGPNNLRLSLTFALTLARRQPEAERGELGGKAGAEGRQEVTFYVNGQSVARASAPRCRRRPSSSSAPPPRRRVKTQLNAASSALITPRSLKKSAPMHSSTPGASRAEKVSKYPRWESNPQSSDPESDALSIRPRGREINRQRRLVRT